MDIQLSTMGWLRPVSPNGMVGGQSAMARINFWTACDRYDNRISQGKQTDTGTYGGRSYHKVNDKKVSELDSTSSRAIYLTRKTLSVIRNALVCLFFQQPHHVNNMLPKLISTLQIPSVHQTEISTYPSLIITSHDTF